MGRDRYQRLRLEKRYINQQKLTRETDSGYLKAVCPEHRGCLPISWWPFGKEFYIENKRFDRDTLRVPSRSPTPTSKANDFRGQSDDIWGGAGAPISGQFWGFPGSGLAQKIYMC